MQQTEKSANSFTSFRSRKHMTFMKFIYSSIHPSTHSFIHEHQHQSNQVKKWNTSAVVLSVAKHRQTAKEKDDGRHILMMEMLRKCSLCAAARLANLNGNKSRCGSNSVLQYANSNRH